MTIKVTYNVTDVYMSQSVSPVYITVSYSDGGASGGGVWGSITGTLSNQTDLQTALDLKVPYTGATGNVDLGEYELKAGQVEFDQTPTGTAGVGVMRWNDTDGTVDLGLKGGNVTLQVGQEQVARVVNKTGANLLESEYKVVKVTSAQGQRLAVDLAQANNDNNSADTLGIVTENIDNNQEGFITTMGTIRGINTTGSLQGETWTDGDVLYLSGTTAGAITNVKPTAPLHIVVVGYVEYAHQNNGKIFVKVMNGWEIDELHNVLISSPTNNQGLFYNSTSTLWENKSITTALGYTPVPTTRNITINGVTYDLSADRTWTIAAGISGSGASGQVTYWTGASAVSGSNNLFWDNTNSRLGIGTNAPDTRLHVTGSTTASGAIARGINFTPTLVAAANNDIIVGLDINPTFNIGAFSGVNSLGLRVLNGAVTIGTSQYTYKEINSGNYDGISIFSVSGSAGKFQMVDAGATSQSWNFVQENSTSARIRYASINAQMVSNTAGAETGILRFFTKSSGSSVSEALRIWSNQNVLIQNAGTYSDLGVRFGVVGDTILRGSGATSATTALTVQNSSSTNLFRVFNNGEINIGGGTQDYVFAKRANLVLTLQSQLTGSLQQTEYYTKDGDGTDDNGFAIFARGIPSDITNFEQFRYFYSASLTSYVIGTNKGGTGVFRDIRIGNSLTPTDLIVKADTGNILVNTTTDVASSRLTINSTTQGFLPPRMTTTQKNAIATPAAGLLVYDTTLNKLCVYTTAWETITSI